MILLPQCESTSLGVNASRRVRVLSRSNPFEHSHATTPKNNGNILSQTTVVPAVEITPGFAAVQNYHAIGTNRSWNQTFEYYQHCNPSLIGGPDDFPYKRMRNEFYARSLRGRPPPPSVLKATAV